MEEKVIKKILLTSLGLIILDITIGGFFFRFLPEKIPLFYSRPWGNEQLANNFFIFLLPALSLFVLVFSFLILRFSRNKLEKPFNWILACSSLIFSLLGAISLIKIVILMM